jgi:regulator of ribosome biosynthesis
MQTLVHELWQLPTDLVDGFPIAKMPAPSYRLPREKPVPVPKPPTKWETFAAAKGIQNRKRSRMDFDEETGKEMPRYGYGSKANIERDEVSVMVYNDQEDPYVDKFADMQEKKKDRVAGGDLLPLPLCTMCGPMTSLRSDSPDSAFAPLLDQTTCVFFY